MPSNRRRKNVFRHLQRLSVLVAASVAIVSAQQPAPFVSRSTLVVVPAVVLDNKGQAIGSLLQDDFEIFEDGQKVEISTFVPADDAQAAGREDGRFIVMLLDDMRIAPERVWKVKDIAKNFANRMGPKDVVSVIKTNGGKATTTTSKAEVLSMIDRFSVHPMAGEQSLERDSDHAMQTIGELANQLAVARHRRKVLVIIGSAMLFSPQTPDWPSSTQPVGEYSPFWFNAIRETSRNNISVYVMDPVGLVNNGGERYDAAKSFAAETGGEAMVNTNDINKAVGRIWQDAGSYYLLGYVPSLDDGKPHKIEVKVKRAGAQVRARRSRG